MLNTGVFDIWSVHCPVCKYPIFEGSAFCTRCGAFLENARSGSGEDIDTGRYTQEREPAQMPADHLYYYPHEVRGKSRKVFPAIFVAMILLVASVLGVLYVFPPEYDLFKPDEYVIYGSGAVLSGKIGIESDSSDTDPYDETAGIILTSGPYSSMGYTWDVRPIDPHISTSVGDSVSESGPDLRRLACMLKPGFYSVKLTVDGSTYTGAFALEGEVVREYSWKYDRIIEYGSPLHISHEFEMEFRFLYGDTISSIKYNGIRGHPLYRDLDEILTLFVSDSHTITSKLESMLRGEFDKEDIPQSFVGVNDFHYASYLLAFVQQTVSYVEDAHLYGVSEYWAFPAETIMRGQGDCEDTTFLCAALFKAAGFEAAVGVLPGHAMAGVYLPGLILPENAADYEDYTPVTMTNFERPNYLVCEEIDDKLFYGCETTHVAQFPIGYTNVLNEGNQLKDYIPDGSADPKNKTDGFYVISDY